MADILSTSNVSIWNESGTDVADVLGSLPSSLSTGKPLLIAGPVWGLQGSVYVPLSLNDDGELKVEANITSISSGVNAFTQKLTYNDMNATTGGVARGTTITEAAGWVRLYAYTGSGLYTGMSLGLATANSGWFVRLLLDSTYEIFGAAGILSTDVDNSYGLSVGTQNTITTGINLGTNASFFYHSSPTYNPTKFDSKIEIFVKRKTGSGSKLFNAGLITLTQEV